MLVRAWRAWQNKSRLLAPTRRLPQGSFFAVQLIYPELREDGPALRPYEGLAAIWHEYAAHSMPDYPAFLAGLARARGLELRSVLDLACGAGTLTERLTTVVPVVVGLDASEEMLIQARTRCADRPPVTFERGDFRDFGLGRRFDAVVCAQNSLNYLDATGDLGRVFRSVSAHLNPGGLFVCDTTTGRGMELLAGNYFHAEVAGSRLAMRFTYDRGRRRAVTFVLLRAGVEAHRRMPIDPGDVKGAATEAGLRVDDYFCTAAFPGWFVSGPSMFFVLSKPS